MNKQTKFILIDDNEIDTKVNVNLLKIMDLGEEYLDFFSCCEGLDYIKANLDSFNGFNVIILLDIQMPDVDGFECMKKYEDLPQSFIDQTKVFFLSSTIDEHDIRRAKDKTLAINILEKPLDVFVLKKHLGLEL